MGDGRSLILTVDMSLSQSKLCNRYQQKCQTLLTEKIIQKKKPKLVYLSANNSISLKSLMFEYCVWYNCIKVHSILYIACFHVEWSTLFSLQNKCFNFPHSCLNQIVLNKYFLMKCLSVTGPLTELERFISIFWMIKEAI